MSKQVKTPAGPQKLRVTKTITDDAYVEGSFDEVIKRINELRTQHEGAGVFTNIRFEYVGVDYGPYSETTDKQYLGLVGDRLETDEEFEKRVKLEREREVFVLERERQEFERLSKKFRGQ
jgi:hypothetical protein